MISALPFAPPEQLDQVHLKTNDRTWTNFWNLPCLYNKNTFFDFDEILFFDQVLQYFTTFTSSFDQIFTILTRFLEHCSLLYYFFALLYLYFFVKKMGRKKLLINISLKPQGTNGRLYIDFGLHPNFWKFLRCCAALFLRAETDIRELLFASNSFKISLFFSSVAVLFFLSEDIS